MQYSNEFQSRHGFANFDNKTFKITNKKDDTTINCSLIKVPDYSFKSTYRENICEGNGWYSKGEKITETITYDFYWIVVFENKCIGTIRDNQRKTLSLKYAISNLNGLNFIKDFLRTI